MPEDDYDDEEDLDSVIASILDEGGCTVDRQS